MGRHSQNEFSNIGEEYFNLIKKILIKRFCFNFNLYKNAFYLQYMGIYKDMHAVVLCQRVTLHDALIGERQGSVTKKARDGTTSLKAPWEAGILISSPRPSMYC